MAEYRFRPNKKLAQHFVVSKELIEGLVEAAKLNSSDTVLEIGPGTGFLTKAMLEKCRVNAVEKDEKFFNLLRNEILSEKFSVQNADFLNLSGNEMPEFNKIVSLPPYNLSHSIVEKILFLDFDKTVLVFQLEFCEKLSAEPGFKNYNALSVLTNYFCEPQTLGPVSPDSFFPMPKSASQIISFTKKKRFGTAKNERLFWLFLRQVFRFRNKSFSNAFKMALPFISRKKVSLPGLKINGEKVCQIGVKDFVDAFNAIF